MFSTLWFNVLIALYSLLFFYLAWKRRDLALSLIIVALPSYLIRSSLFSIPFTLLEAMILTSFLAWFIKEGWYPFVSVFKKKSLEEKKEKIKYPFRLEIIAWLLVSFLAVVIADFNSSALGIWKAYFFEPLLFYILIINTFKSRKDWPKIFWALAFSAFFVSLLALYQKLSGQLIFNEFWAAKETRRVVSFFGYPNAVGLYLLPLILLLLGFIASKISFLKNKLSWSYLGFLIFVVFISLSAIVFAKSEGALIGLVGGLFVFFFLLNRRSRQITSLLALIIIGLVFLNPRISGYLGDKVRLMDLSGQIRQQQWQETIKMMRAEKNILWGAGLASYQEAISPYHQPGIFIKNDDPEWLDKIRNSKEYRDTHWQPVEIYLYPHNVLLNFWTEMGLLGLLVFLWLSFKYFFLSIKLWLREKKENTKEKFLLLGLISSYVAILIHGIVDVPYFKNDLSLLFWLSFALVGLFLLNRKREKKK